MRFIGDDPDLVDLPAPPRRIGWRALWRGAVDLLLPPLCPACGVRVLEPAALCPACWSALRFIERPFCEVTATPFDVDPGPGMLSPEAYRFAPPWRRARAAVLYEGAAPRLVQAVKYSDRHEVVALLARLMARAGADVLAGAELIVPVPLHHARLRQRRFNQSALLARQVANIAAKPFAVDLLLRRKPTRPQVGLSRDARARNLAGAFSVESRRAGALAGRHLVLVDDVYTSGATLAAATRVLKRAGAAEVDVLVFARVAEAIALV